ncbi:hypothetical protein QE152_g9902 [Popillia japonica]|uniref:PiggyBac transposable element-derived protein domain-containing protein n=1 Tax=Popillia japonica TaxID=7064 RepID=A0AAW1LYH5_POPJA
MGGVDLQDSVLGLHPIQVRSKRLYHRMFYRILDVVEINAWILDRRIKPQLSQQNKIVPLSIVYWMLLKSTHGYWIEESNLSLASKIKLFLYLPSKQICSCVCSKCVAVNHTRRGRLLEFQNHKKNATSRKSAQVAKENLELNLRNKKKRDV